MRNKIKEQKLIFSIKGSVAEANGYLEDGWELKNLYPASDGTYILLERESYNIRLDEINNIGNFLCALSDLGVSTLNNDGTVKSIEQIITEMGEAWDSKYL